MIMEETNLPEQSSPKRFRLVVRSAEEAVRMIREKLGENARVVSVRQTGGEGLKDLSHHPSSKLLQKYLVLLFRNIVQI